jgi:CRISPR-associated protein Cas1
MVCVCHAGNPRIFLDRRAKPCALHEKDNSAAVRGIKMETVYITKENTTIHRCSEHLSLRKEGRQIATIPLRKVKTLVLLTSVQLTTQAIDIIFEHNIDVIFTSRSGKIKGRLMSERGGGAELRLAQYGAYTDHERRLSIGKAIVGAKVKNQMRFIEKKIRHNPEAIYKEERDNISKYLKRLDGADSIDEIMGVEGICARVYWDGFRQLLKEPLFTHREYRPAPDIVNSALNLAYSFLASEITTCLAANHFDLEIGFLHGIHHGRNSLTYDIMEAFRSPFADAWLLRLFNKRMLTPEHFRDAKDGYYLNDEGFAKFCSMYHEHVEEGKWESIFREQAAVLKKSLLEGTGFSPYLYD